MNTLKFISGLGILYNLRRRSITNHVLYDSFHKFIGELDAFSCWIEPLSQRTLEPLTLEVEAL